MKYLLALTVTLLGLLGAASADDAVQKELALMKGAWKVVSFEIDGRKPLSDADLDKFLITIDADGRFTATFADKLINESTNKIDPTKTPKTIDTVFTKGPMKGKTSLALYELKGDTLKLCAGDPDQERPADMSGKGSTLAVYKRQKGK